MDEFREQYQCITDVFVPAVGSGLEDDTGETVAWQGTEFEKLLGDISRFVRTADPKCGGSQFATIAWQNRANDLGCIAKRGHPSESSPPYDSPLEPAVARKARTSLDGCTSSREPFAANSNSAGRITFGLATAQSCTRPRCV